MLIERSLTHACSGTRRRIISGTSWRLSPAYVIATTVLTVACITPLSKLGFLPYPRIRATVGDARRSTAFLIVASGFGFPLPSSLLITSLVVKPYLLRIWCLSCQVQHCSLVNLYLLPLPPCVLSDFNCNDVYTEEKWLLEQFGDEYKEYCNESIAAFRFPKLTFTWVLSGATSPI